MEKVDRQKSSMCYWYPKIKNLDIPQPKTEIVELKKDHVELMAILEDDFSVLDDVWSDIIKAARKIGFPLFMRTDHYSAKHNWKDTCYVEKEEYLKQHISTLFDCSYSLDIVGLPLTALVFREYIPMNTIFKAFYGQLPINPEYRIMIKNGVIDRMFWYWVEDAIEISRFNPQVKNWKRVLKNAQKSVTAETMMKLQDMATLVEKEVEGYWSVDFCQAKDGTWYLIDMGAGNLSWQPGV
jgi:hypothetical protein